VRGWDVAPLEIGGGGLWRLRFASSSSVARKGSLLVSTRALGGVEPLEIGGYSSQRKKTAPPPGAPRADICHRGIARWAVESLEFGALNVLSLKMIKVLRCLLFSFFLFQTTTLASISVVVQRDR
jgi:hypothetical protein